MAISSLRTVEIKYIEINEVKTNPSTPVHLYTSFDQILLVAIFVTRILNINNFSFMIICYNKYKVL